MTFAISEVKAIDVLSNGIEEIASSLDKNEDRPIEVDDIADDMHDQNDEHTTEDGTIPPRVGDCLEICWTLELSYFPGVLSAVDFNGLHILFGDRKQEGFKLREEHWRVLPVRNAHFPSIELQRNDHKTLGELLETFGNKAFMRHHAQGFPIIRSYILQEA